MGLPGHTPRASEKNARRIPLETVPPKCQVPINWAIDSATRTGHCSFQVSNSHAAPCVYLLAAALME